MINNIPGLAEDIKTSVTAALNEDLGGSNWQAADPQGESGDITAQLIPASNQAEAVVITREACIFCGEAWVEETFRQLDPNVEIIWHIKDGDKAQPNDKLFSLKGSARSLLTGERTALNFVQLLSGVSTSCAEYADLVKGSKLRILDTRKTIPGLRTAQKYAVTLGGCYNHRIGLYDAFLIKENHIAACGGIAEAVQAARELAPQKPVEIEVESLEELQLALNAGAHLDSQIVVMLDNFSFEDMVKAVEINKDQAKLEASGNVSKQTLPEIAKTGVDYTSIGALTKHCVAIDLSMKLTNENTSC